MELVDVKSRPLEIDSEKESIAAEHFSVRDVKVEDIEACFGQCAACESTHDLLKKWKKLKLKVLAAFASNLQRKLHPLSSKICVDRLIEILERYRVLVDECAVDDGRDNDAEYERELLRLRRSLQIYWIHYIKGPSESVCAELCLSLIAMSPNHSPNQERRISGTFSAF